MEKDAHLVQAGPCKVHACFEEAETLRILTCLEVAEGKVTYKGATEEPGRRHKHFSFDSISFLTEKLVLVC